MLEVCSINSILSKIASELPHPVWLVIVRCEFSFLWDRLLCLPWYVLISSWWLFFVLCILLLIPSILPILLIWLILSLLILILLLLNTMSFILDCVPILISTINQWMGFLLFRLFSSNLLFMVVFSFLVFVYLFFCLQLIWSFCSSSNGILNQFLCFLSSLFLGSRDKIRNLSQFITSVVREVCLAIAPTPWGIGLDAVARRTKLQSSVICLQSWTLLAEKGVNVNELDAKII